MPHSRQETTEQFELILCGRCSKLPVTSIFPWLFEDIRTLAKAKHNSLAMVKAGWAGSVFKGLHMGAPFRGYNVLERDL